MLKVEKLTHYIFYLGLVITLLSLTNIQLPIHSKYINLVPTILGLTPYIFYVRARKLPDGTFQSLGLVFVYSIIIFLFHNRFEIEWSIITLLIYLPLIRSEEKGFLKGIITIKLIVVSMIVAATLIGVVSDTTLVKFNGVAHSLGFFHPNTLGTIFLSIFLDSILLLKGIKNHYILIFFGLFLYLDYRITYSRTSFLVISFAILVFLFRNILKKIEINKFLFSMSTVIIFLIGIFISVFYNSANPFYVQLDAFLSNRIRLGSLYIQRYDFDIFPQFTPNIIPAGWWSYDQLFNDNTYLKFILSQGILLTILLLSYLIFQIYRKKFTLFNAMLIILTFAVLVTEALGFNIFLFTPLLLNYMSISKNTETI
ncbi:hypothetical protein [Streptococcus suis]|uniref:Oligosaccharide repeat unit polymerase n=1 Tax=Streptococcus suis TaxID=1307 RepID=A0A116MEI8_STRSU|nr:hypothetical protein [Streptococcus suis]NQG64819.1 hypothetical protein [Streptococcus suis]NQG66591.1 hypothetical protein [Streptococcus suis]CYV43282.1 oligosaccharide repeat unit polymerase [Streptococcus suis]CYV64396.1 oligosaccharide repeat unit polymerase [Streptococcus suis]